MVLYDGQAAEHAACDTHFTTLYWRMRRYFRTSAQALLFSQLQSNLVQPFACLIVGIVIIRTGSLDGAKPNPENVLSLTTGAWEDL